MKQIGAAAAMLVLAWFAIQTFVAPRFFAKKSYVPAHSEYVLFDNIWSQEELSQLLDRVRALGAIQSTAKDLTSSVEHIGEALPLSPGGVCPQYLVPNLNQTLCVLPSRLDVALNYFSTGGFDEKREYYDTLASRLQIFAHYTFNRKSSDPALETLFQSRAYLTGTAKVCGGREVLDPVQVGTLVMLPGQAIPHHLDVPYFFGSTRFNTPQYLLIAMEYSQLFEDLRVRMSQGVAYLHSWYNASTDSGNFFFYPNGTEGESVSIPSIYNTGITLDGTVVVHGVNIFRNQSAVQYLNPSAKNELRYTDNDIWHLYADDVFVREYQTTDLRISLAWRSRCFESQEALEKWYNVSDSMTIETILERFRVDLRTRGVLSATADPAPLDLAKTIIQEYIVYPREHKNMIPFNYCMLPTVAPRWAATTLKSLLSPFCI